MRYVVQRYQRYPIFEPAEGSYYYDGIEPEEHPCSIHNTKKEAIDALHKLVDVENNELLDSYYKRDNNDIPRGSLRLSSGGESALSIRHKYIGEGCEYYVEPINRRGRHRRGWQPYQ